MKTIFLRTFWQYIIIILFISLITFASSYVIIRTFYLENTENHLRNLANGVQEQIARLILAGDDRALNAEVVRLGNTTNSRITIVNRNGRVLADSEEDPAQMDNHLNRPEIETAFAGRISSQLRTSRTLKKKLLYFAAPLTIPGQGQYALRLSVFVHRIDQLIKRLSLRVLIINIAVILCAILLSFFFSRSIARPVKRLQQAANEAAQGNLDAKVFIKSNDELQALADSFNNMLSRQQESFTNLQHNQEQLRTIISTIREGLMVLDEEGEILLCNQELCRLCERADCKGYKYWELFREPDFIKLVQAATGEHKEVTAEINIRATVYLVQVIPMSKISAFVVTFFDLSEYKHLEKIKNDFISNISHELRTPLTSIKGFIETMEDEGTRHPYLDIIKRNTNRLINIVSDLLVLSNLEHKELDIHWQMVNLSRLITQVVTIFKPKIAEKDLSLTHDLSTPEVIVRGDAFKLEQVLVNLIDNAIKYTEQGEIGLRLRQENDWAVLQVSDTGIGIREEVLPRIFERFFVADPSRSKRLGGTGLGLSIVKHIVQLHHGDISVDSRFGKGTTFTITLPVNENPTS